MPAGSEGLVSLYGGAAYLLWRRAAELSLRVLVAQLLPEFLTLGEPPAGGGDPLPKDGVSPP